MLLWRGRGRDMVSAPWDSYFCGLSSDFTSRAPRSRVANDARKLMGKLNARMEWADRGSSSPVGLW